MQTTLVHFLFPKDVMIGNMLYRGDDSCRPLKMHIFICSIDRRHMTSHSSLRISYGPVKYASPRLDLSRSLQLKDNGTKWNLIYNFLSIINSKSVVILNRFADIGYWKPVTWINLYSEGRGLNPLTPLDPPLQLFEEIRTSTKWYVLLQISTCLYYTSKWEKHS